ncbi:hypothetical protein ACYG9R_17845 [Mesorhizobium sp. RSR565B]|uniref:hypothetical protein n=1 Tax=unclassified Mesorhizobium TaxID=325217 RepID=UPI0012DF002D|nr:MULTISPECIES: hypothetical protein [unclassified Mesorhizobium]
MHFVSKRVAVGRLLAAISLSFWLGGCACSLSGGGNQDRPFTVFRPHKVVIYRPVAGTPPSNDLIYIYFAVQNNARPNAPMCFAHFNPQNLAWRSGFGHDLVPKISITARNAPIIGRPEVRNGGISGIELTTGERFPAVAPDPSDFPLNEANYRRDFAILVRPDRRAVGKSGSLDVTVTFDIKEGKQTKSFPEEVSFSIPISLVDSFRPETMVPEQSEPVR